MPPEVIANIRYPAQHLRTAWSHHSMQPFDEDQQRLAHFLDRLERQSPGFISRSIQWLRRPEARWLRFPAGILLIIGGVFSFLPILGLWMLPLGFLLLALDVPFLRGPVGKSLAWLERKWDGWKNRKRR